jgi:hypothetical protein
MVRSGPPRACCGRAAHRARTVLFFAVATLALRLLWRSRGSATTTGRRLLLPYTAVMLALGVTIFAIEMYAVSNAVRLSAAGVPFAGLVPGVSIGAEIAINALGQLVALMNDAFLVRRPAARWTRCGGLTAVAGVPRVFDLAPPPLGRRAPMPPVDGFAGSEDTPSFASVR